MDGINTTYPGGWMGGSGGSINEAVLVTGIVLNLLGVDGTNRHKHYFGHKKLELF